MLEYIQKLRNGENRNDFVKVREEMSEGDTLVKCCSSKRCDKKASSKKRKTILYALPYSVKTGERSMCSMQLGKQNLSVPSKGNMKSCVFLPIVMMLLVYERHVSMKIENISSTHQL